MSKDPKFDHIDINEKKKVLNECAEAENWFREKQQQQNSLPKHANPVLLSAEIRRKAEAVDRFCKPIMTKPRPAAKPATPSGPATPSSQGDEQLQSHSDTDANSNENAADSGSPAAPSSTEPMETDKSGNAGNA